MPLPIRTLVLLYRGSTFMTSFNLNYLLIPRTATLGVRASTYVFWEDTYIRSITKPNFEWNQV